MYDHDELIDEITEELRGIIRDKYVETAERLRALELLGAVHGLFDIE